MIMREWRGWVRTTQAPEYLAHQHRTGITDLRATPGNLAAWALSREDGERTEVVVLSLWEDEDSIRAFAGDDPAVARFYSGDDPYFLDRWLHTVNYAVFNGRA